MSSKKHFGPPQPGNPPAREEITLAGTHLTTIERELSHDDETELITIQFPDEQIRGINGLAKSEEFGSESDVIREAVARMLADERENAVPEEWLL